LGLSGRETRRVPLKLDYELNPAGRDDLRWMIERLTGAVGRAIDAVSTTEPMVAACLYYTADGADMLDPASMWLCTAERRREIVERYGAGASSEVWNFAEYMPGPEAWLPDDFRDTAFQVREHRLVRELRAAGCDEPARLVLNHVARGLQTHRWSFPVVEPFVTFVFDPSFGARLIENLEFVVARDARAVLETARLWPEADADV
jgi:hypothetical protein